MARWRHQGVDDRVEPQRRRRKLIPPRPAYAWHQAQAEDMLISAIMRHDAVTLIIGDEVFNAFALPDPRKVIINHGF